MALRNGLSGFGKKATSVNDEGTIVHQSKQLPRGARYCVSSVRLAQRNTKIPKVNSRVHKKGGQSNAIAER